MKNNIAKNFKTQIECLYAKQDTLVCNLCGTEHEKDAKTFSIVAGNIYIGLYGGMVGNNFEDNGQLKNISIFCRTNSPCFLKVLGF